MFLPLVRIALVCAGTLNCTAISCQFMLSGSSTDIHVRQQCATQAYLFCSILHNCCEGGLLWNIEPAITRGWSACCIDAIYCECAVPSLHSVWKLRIRGEGDLERNLGPVKLTDRYGCRELSHKVVRETQWTPNLHGTRKSSVARCSTVGVANTTYYSKLKTPKASRALAARAILRHVCMSSGARSTGFCR